MTLDARAMHFPLTVMYLVATVTDFYNVTILCPQSLKVKETIIGSSHHIYSCKIACGFNEYTFLAGHGTLHSSSSTKYNSIVKNASTKCFPCPIGATCDNRITSLPNYWVFKNESDFVAMIRCPEGYCCTEPNNCLGIGSCNTDRTGTFCGSCLSNMTESLFSTKCIHVDQCSTSLVVSLYVFCAGIYATALLTGQSIKNFVLGKANDFCQYLRKLFAAGKSKHSDKDGQELTEITTKDECTASAELSWVLMMVSGKEKVWERNTTTKMWKHKLIQK